MENNEMAKIVVIDDDGGFLSNVRSAIKEHEIFTSHLYPSEWLELSEKVRQADLIFLDHRIGSFVHELGEGPIDGDRVYSWLCQVLGEERAAARTIGISSGDQPYLKLRLLEARLLFQDGVNEFLNDPSAFPQCFK